MYALAIYVTGYVYKKDKIKTLKFWLTNKCINSNNNNILYNI